MVHRDDHRDDHTEIDAAIGQSRRVLATGFVALTIMAVAALLTPPLFLS